MSKLYSGQSLIEVLVSITIVVILAVSLITTTLISQKTSRSARDNTVAAKLAQEYIELARVIRDNQGFDKFKGVDSKCFEITVSGPGSWNLNEINCVPGKSEIVNKVTYSRRLKVKAGANIRQKVVEVTVNWTDSSGTRTVTNTTILSDCVNTTTSC